MDDDAAPTVLVVEDERELARLYASWLGRRYEVEAVNGGDEAVDRLDDDVDVVLLDRRMPGRHGDDVLSAIREGGIDVRVAMVTAVEPDFDVVEMGFDDYLLKPVTEDDLLEAVERLLRYDEYDAGVRELFSLARRRALLAEEKDRAELAASDAYSELRERFESNRERVEGVLGELSAEDYERLFRGFSDGPNE